MGLKPLSAAKQQIYMNQSILNLQGLTFFYRNFSPKNYWIEKPLVPSGSVPQELSN
jgi:hypothetical protein